VSAKSLARVQVLGDACFEGVLRHLFSLKIYLKIIYRVLIRGFYVE